MGEEITTKEVMEILGVSRRTVQSWVKSGKLKVKKDAQGRNIFSRSVVESVKNTENAQHTSEDTPRISFSFDPAKQVIIEREHYEGLLIRLAQVEVENRTLREEKLIEDKRPWWKRIFG